MPKNIVFTRHHIAVTPKDSPDLDPIDFTVILEEPLSLEGDSFDMNEVESRHRRWVDSVGIEGGNWTLSRSTDDPETVWTYYHCLTQSRKTLQKSLRQ